MEAYIGDGRVGYYCLVIPGDYIPANISGIELSYRTAAVFGAQVVLLVCPGESSDNARARFERLYPDKPDIVAGLMWRLSTVRHRVDRSQPIPLSTVPPDMRH